MNDGRHLAVAVLSKPTFDRLGRLIWLILGLTNWMIYSGSKYWTTLSW